MSRSTMRFYFEQRFYRLVDDHPIQHTHRVPLRRVARRTFETAKWHGWHKRTSVSRRRLIKARRAHRYRNKNNLRRGLEHERYDKEWLN